MSLPEYIVPFCVSLLIGALIGVEREKRKQSLKDMSPMGIRTSILTSLFGTVAAFLGTQEPGIFLLSLGAIITLTAATHIALIVKKGRIGLTTEISIVLTFLYGAMCAMNQIQAAVILAIITTLILSTRKYLHEKIKNISGIEMFDTLKFAIIAFIILPLLPDQSFDQEIMGFLFPSVQPSGTATTMHAAAIAMHGIDILNPYRIWLLVVIASGVSFLGYILVKTAGKKIGVGLAGLTGGLYSSTATSITLAQRSKEMKKSPNPFVAGIVLACGISFIKMFIFIRALNAELFEKMLVPMGLMMAYLLATGFYCMFQSSPKEIGHKSQFETPFKLSKAIKLGAFIVGTLVIAKVALSYAGVEWYYAVATLMSVFAIDDPIIISTASAAGGLIDFQNAKNIILLVIFLNTIQKIGIVWFFGNRKMVPRMVKIFAGLLLVTTLGFVYF